MFRNLNAIEIAEGALLADIAVIFQLLTLYLPIGGDIFRTLIFVVYSLLVLRRGLYVGVMGLCVSMFIVAVLTGFQDMFVMLTEGVGGLFLGVTMKHRFHHIPLLSLGIVGGAFALYAQVIVFMLLAGQPLNRIIMGLHLVYNHATIFANVLAFKVGLGLWWKQSAFPAVSSLANWAFTYWWFAFYLLLCVLLTPIVGVIYAVTNASLRLLGYEVRPFPGGRVGNLFQRLRRQAVKAAIKWKLLKKFGVRRA